MSITEPKGSGNFFWACVFKNPLFTVAIAMTIGVAIWGILDTPGLTSFAANYVEIAFQSRGWFIMLTASIMLISSIVLAVSKYEKVVLGKEGESPEFSTTSWMAMMFAAGMGVGLLFYGAAKPISHHLAIIRRGVAALKIRRLK